MNSPDDHTDRLLGLCHNQRPQQQQSALLPNIGGAMPPPEMQMQMLGGFSTTTTSAPDCQQPQRSLPVECDSVDLTCTTSDSSVAADPDDMNKLTSLLEFYNHDLDRVQMHLEGALRHTQTQQQDLLHRKAHLEARKQLGAMGDQKAPQQKSPNGASLLDSLAAFVGTGAADNSNSNSSANGGGPQTTMHLPNQAQHDMILNQQVMTQPQQQQQQQQQARGSSSSPGILSYTGTIKTTLVSSQASSPLLDMATASANRHPSSLNPTGDDACSVGSSSLPISMSLGTQAQAQASYGTDVAFSAGSNNTGIHAGADADGDVGSFMMQQQANIHHGMMNGPPAPSSSLSMKSSNCQNAMFGNTNNTMINGGTMASGGEDSLNLGTLTPPTHPSAQSHGGPDNRLQSHNNIYVQQHSFQQEQQQQQQQQQSLFSIGPSALMAESPTTPSPVDMGSIPSMPQNVLRSQSVGSVQSTISFASTGSASMTSDLGNNNRGGRMVGGGGFLGPGRALGPGGIGIKRAKRSRARSDGSNISSIDADNSMAAKSNIQALLRLHASIGGKQPNAAGMCPIHVACRDYPTNARLIGTMLCTSPGVGRLVVGRGSSVGAPAMERRASLSSINSGESSRSNAIVMEGSYPIHIALAYSANVDVVKLLVRQNPELLVKGDGTNRVPLSIAFSQGASLDVLDLLLDMNPNAAAIPDLRNNYPLHLACARRTGGGGRGQINLPILKRLVEAFPAAVHKLNFNGKTPLELAQDGGLTDDDAISYLNEMAYMEKDDDVIEAPDA